jgi:hypothetical protein
MASTKKTATKKVAAKKTFEKKTVAPKVTAKKTAVAKKAVTAKKTDNKPIIKKGSKLNCKLCGFAITVDNISGTVEEAYLECCEMPMNLKQPTAKKK